MKTWIKVVIFLVLLLAFNVSYLSNSGLLILGLKRAKQITQFNAHLHTTQTTNLSTFRMDQLLNKQECEELGNKVYNMRVLWEKRNAAMSTLGTASYLDAASPEAYVKRAEKTNPMMLEAFGPLLEKVRSYFQDLSKCNVEYKTNAALPGFHIFDCNNLFSWPVASVHRDMQWNRLTHTKEEEIDTSHTMSFTLAVELPPGGGGLYTFEGASSFHPALNLFIPRALVSSLSPKTKIEYAEGFIVTHDGQTNHMIAPCNVSVDKRRITLQGHGVYEKNKKTWYLYW